MDVNLDIYGKRDVTGQHDEDGEPCPRYWDEKRQCWSDEWKKFLNEYDLLMQKEAMEKYKFRPADPMPTPNKLMDIVNLGITYPHLSIACIAELLD